MKDKKKTKTIPRQVRWDKLDNTAHLFPSIAGESMTNVYRISVTLKEEVQVEFLQQALDMILPKFDGFNLRMRTGVFWYYFEENGKKAPKVTEEAMFPCRFIRQNKNRNYLFRVTYYKSRINLEVFHVLTDGVMRIRTVSMPPTVRSSTSAKETSIPTSLAIVYAALNSGLFCSLPNRPLINATSLFIP